MRSFKGASVVFASILSVSRADDGSCLGWTDGASSVVNDYDGSTGKVSWFVELTLSAVQQATKNNPTQFASVNEVAAIGAIAYAAQGLLISQTNKRNDQLTNGINGDVTFQATLPTDCGLCILAYAQEVYDMYGNGTLPVRCQTYSGLTNNIQLCYYALSQAITNFDTCTETTTTDLALGTTVAFTATGARCTASQIAELEGKYGIYQNIMSRGLFGSFADADFQTAYKALPCKAVFDALLDQFNTAVLTSIKTSGTCGATVATEKIFDTSCTTATFSGSTTVAQTFTELEDTLGGGVPIYTSNDHPRCSADDISILHNFNLFDAFVQCSDSSTMNVNPGGLDDFRDCLALKWVTMGDALVGSASVSCSGCFTSVAIGMNALKATTLDECVGDNDSFSPLCALQLASNRYLDDLYSCSGFKLDTTNTVGTNSEIVDNPTELNSIIPFVGLAKAIMSDSSLTSNNDRFVAALAQLQNVPMFSDLGSAPFAPCYGALVMELLYQFENVPDALNSCANEFDSACLENSYVVGGKTRFEACSGIELETTTPYTCSDEQFEVLSDSNLPLFILSQALSNSTSTIAYVMENIVSALVQIQSITNDTLPCANCLGDVVVAMFDLPDNVKEVCAALEPSECLNIPGVIEIAAKFSQCSGQSLDFSVTSTTATPTDPATEPTTKSSSALVVFGSVVLVVASMML